MRAGYLLLVIAVWTILLNGILAMAGYNEVAHITAAIIATGVEYPALSLSLLATWFAHDMLHLAMDTKAMKRFI